MNLVDMTDRDAVHRRLSEMAETRAWMDYELGRRTVPMMALSMAPQRIVTLTFV